MFWLVRASVIIVSFLTVGDSAWAVLNGGLVADASKFSKQIAQIEVQNEIEFEKPKIMDGMPVVGITQIESCTATFISRDLMLTAAHCLAVQPYTSIHIRLGKGLQTFETTAKRAVFDTGFSDKNVSSAHDMALIQTTDLLPDGYFVTPVNFTPDVPSYFVMIGFGNSPKPMGPLSTELRYATAVRSIEVDSTVIGITPSGKGFVTYGDSGGPLLAPTKNGFTQFGVAGGLATIPGLAIYASTYENRLWIFAALKNLRHENAAGWRTLAPAAL